MNMRSLFVALGLALACAASGWSEPVRAQQTAAEYGEALSGLHAEMNSLTLELERFIVSRRYCKPPDIPSKAEAQAEFDALAARARALGDRYVTLRGGLTDLAKVSGPGGYLMAGGADPTNVSYWRAYEAARRRMNDALARKRQALAAAPELDCRPKPKPKPAPAVTTGGFQPPATPVRPSATATAWPELPKQFCSQEEYWAFINRLNQLTVQVAADAERAAKFRADVEQAINEYVQKDQPVPPPLLAQRRQANADYNEQQRKLREADETVRRAKAIPVVDCGRDRRTGMTDLDRTKVAAQQEYVGETEALIADIDRLRRAGECERMREAYDRLLDRLAFMRRVVADGRDPRRPPAFPPELLEELRRRAQAAMIPCPPLGAPPRSPSLDELRKAYRAAANGNDEGAFRAAQLRLIQALDEAIARETRDRQSDQLIRERHEVRTAEPVRPGVLDEIGAATPPQGPSQAGFIPADRGMQVILGEHNRLRGSYRLPPLRWDPALAAGAQAYAQQLARTGRLAHAPREGRGAARENLSQGMLSWGPREMLSHWLKEQRYFKPGIYPNVTSTGRWEDVSHLTQMLWPATTSVGCGIADGSGSRWLVCRYLPGGNKDGQYVGPATGALAAEPDKGVRLVPGEEPPPPPPPLPAPTARDDAPGGDESKHPLVVFANNASNAFTDAWRNGDRAAQERELVKLRYALDQLRKRLVAARKVPAQFRTVDPGKVEQEVRMLERDVERAEDRFNGRGEFG